MKLVVVPSKKEYVKEYQKIGADAFIFGLKGFSCGLPCYLSKEEISSLKKELGDKELFISVNKNIFNEELEELEENLIFLDKLGISGVLFYDLSVLHIKKRRNLSLPLVWNQTHMVTNYNTCNYYYEKQVSYGVLSGEITLEEMNEIASNTKMRLFAPLVGYPIMSYTRRSLLSNYFSSIQKKKEKNEYVITNQNENYLLKEEDTGNAIYFGKILNGSPVLNQLETEYAILNEEGIEHEKFVQVLSYCLELLSTKDEKLVSKIDELIGDYRGFFFQKTIYKVKKND